jgi:hypothetical protein
VREAYIIFPTLIPFADSTKLNLSEVSDSLYKTPIYLLFQEGPPAKVRPAPAVQRQQHRRPEHA